MSKIVVCNKADTCYVSGCNWIKPREGQELSGHCSHRETLVKIIPFDELKSDDLNYKFKIRKENGL